MGHAEERNYSGADWYDVCKLLEDLAVSQGVSAQVTIEAAPTSSTANLLCTVQVSTMRPGTLHHDNTAVSIPFRYEHLLRLPIRIHDTLTEVYTLHEHYDSTQQ